MKTITTQSEIGPDDKLRLEVDCQLPPGPAEVTLVVQPVSSPVPCSARGGLFLGKHLSEKEIDEALAEMNEAWKGKLESQGSGGRFQPERQPETLPQARLD